MYGQRNGRTSYIRREGSNEKENESYTRADVRTDGRTDPKRKKRKNNIEIEKNMRRHTNLFTVRADGLNKAKGTEQ